MSQQTGSHHPGGSSSPSGRQFQPTRWSLVVEARSADPERSEAALSELCQRYWYPLYGYVRRLGKSPEVAEDMTQGCFLEILKRGTFARADEEKGKLRSFLLKALKDYLGHERERQNALKRGGNATMISLDLEWAEGVLGQELADPSADPERQFERRWAMTVVNSVMARLQEEHRERGKEKLFQLAAPFLVQTSEQNHKEVALQLGVTEGAIKVAVHRMRKRFRTLFRQEIEDTLMEGEDIDAEVREIMTALG